MVTCRNYVIGKSCEHDITIIEFKIYKLIINKFYIKSYIYFKNIEKKFFIFIIINNTDFN